MHLGHLLYLIFFLSGAAALVFESLWFFQAGLALGNSIWASSLVLASFMAGLAIGNAWVSFRGQAIHRPVRLYAGLELLIAITGTGIVFGLPGITPGLAPWLEPVSDQPLLLNTLRASAGFALMLVPATAMGATLPLLVSALYRQRGRFGEALGGLYGWNTLGAVAGVMATEAFLIEAWGIRGAALFAAACNGAAALLSIVVDRSLGKAHEAGTEPLAEPTREPVTERALGRTGAMILAAAFCLGALLLGLEVIWFRFLVLFVSATPYAFAVMLAVVLAGIGCGGLAGGRWLRASPEASRAAPALCASAGALVLWLYLGFEFYSPLLAPAEGRGLGQVLGLALPLMFPVALVSGLLFTLLGDRLHGELGGETRSAGFLTLANTVGAALGSLVAGFLLLPSLGMETSLFVLALGYAVAAGLAYRAGIRPSPGVATRIAATALALFALTLVFFPHGTVAERSIARAVSAHAPQAEVVAVREGLTETIVYVRHKIFGEPRFYRLITNNHSMSATSLAAQRYMKLFVYLPVALHENPKSALLISYGVGATARALVDNAEFETIDFVDISRDVLEMSREFVSEGRESLDERVSTSPLDDPRVTVHVEDGRFFLQTTPRRFDLITGEPPPPKLAGIVNLYTQEYFQLIYDRLAEGGITSYWLPTHSLHIEDSQAILSAFCAVFADCTLWNGAGPDWIMMGSRGRGVPSEMARIGEQWADPLVGPEMVALGLERPEQIGALFIADAEQIETLTEGVPPLTDDFPRRLSSVLGSGDYRAWMDTEATRERFLTSRGLDSILPAALRSESLEFFPVQRLINSKFGISPAAGPDPGELKLPRVHAMMEEQGLRTLPLWFLAGDYDVIRAARSAVGRLPNQAMIHYELAIWSLTQGEWAEAEAHFRRASAQGNPRTYLPLQAYVLCRGADPAQGQRLLKPLRRDPHATAVVELIERLCDPSLPKPAPGPAGKD